MGFKPPAYPHPVQCFKLLSSKSPGRSLPVRQYCSELLVNMNHQLTLHIGRSMSKQPS